MVSQARASQYALIVPALGYFILLNESFTSVFSLASDRIWQAENTGGRPRFSVSEYRMFFTYYGISIIAFAALVVRIVTPEVLRSRVGADANTELSMEERIDVAEFLANKKQGHPLAQELRQALTEAGIIVADLQPGQESVPENSTPRLRKALRDAGTYAADTSLPLLRFPLALSFLLGAGLAAVPAIDTFARVTSALWHRL